MDIVCLATDYDGALAHDGVVAEATVEALNLRAQNLTIFLQMADGVDDPTWAHHLSAHDVSTWIREAIKDDELAAEARAIEDAGADAAESRKAMRKVIERRYTAPAKAGADAP